MKVEERLTDVRNRHGFTLVELLVVVAVLALLAVVALPNWYQAQTASDVAQAKSDLVTVRNALEAYKLDQGAYVHMNIGNQFLMPPNQAGASGYNYTMERLTTPIAYLSSPAPFWDPFDATGARRIGGATSPPPDEHSFKSYFYVARDDMESVHWGDPKTVTWYIMQSAGPDRVFTYLGSEMNTFLATDTPSVRATLYNNIIYDPTNGLVSLGGIWVTGGVPAGRGSVVATVINAAANSRVEQWREMGE